MTTEETDDIDLILDDRELTEFVEVKKNKKYVIGDIDQSALEDDWEDKVPETTDYDKSGKSNSYRSK